MLELDLIKLKFRFMLMLFLIEEILVVGIKYIKKGFVSKE